MRGARLPRAGRTALPVALSLAMALICAPAAQAQWRVLDPHAAADLTGVSAIDEQIAWASGAAGTVLRTLDGGATWQHCTAPAGGAIRAIQAFDKDTAVAMASGKGGASALYKTADGCATWKKVLANPDAAGDFQALRRATAYDIYLLGQPVDGRFVVYLSHNAGDTWTREEDAGLAVPRGGHGTAGAAAGGEAALANVLSFMAFGAQGDGAPVYIYAPTCKGDTCTLGWTPRPTPLAKGDNAVSSVAGRNIMVPSVGRVTGIGTMPATALVAVGGQAARGTAAAAFSADNGNSWKPASTAPGGYRSAVAFDGDRYRFIAVGPDGTDVTVDDGLIWQPMRPAPGDAPDAAKGWTALSLPFVVGPHGRIGRLSDLPGK